MPSAEALPTLALLAILGLVLLLYCLVALKRPWWATVAALSSLAFVPFWISATVGGFFVSAHLVFAAVAIFAILAREKPRITLTAIDLTLVGLLGLSVLSWLLGLTTVTQPYTFAQAVLFYGFARVAAAAYGTRSLFTVVAVTMSVVAVTMLYEFAAGVNPWHLLALDNGLFNQWSGLQARGNVLRAEGPFGHSIAAGSILAVSAVFAMDAKLRASVRVGLVAVLMAGVLVTISRIGMVTAVLALGLTVLFARTSLSKAAKGFVVTLLLGGVVVYNLALTDVFEQAGSTAVDSAAYRLWLLDLLPLLQPVGYASDFTRSTSGEGSFASYGSIDNFVLEYALKNGWLPAGVLLLLMLVAVVQLVRRRGGAATAAVVAQLPALFTVALITTYGLVFWLSVGLAVAEAVAGRRSPPPAGSHRTAGMSPRQLTGGVPAC